MNTGERWILFLACFLNLLFFGMLFSGLLGIPLLIGMCFAAASAIQTMLIVLIAMVLVMFSKN